MTEKRDDEVVILKKSDYEELMKMVREIHRYLHEHPLLKDRIELLTVIEVSESLDISVSTIYRAISKGIISKDENGKLLPLEIYDAVMKRLIRCDMRYFEEFKKSFIFK